MKDVAEIIKILKKTYPDAKIALNFETEFQLYVAVVLSAQCTDVRVNMVTPPLFGKLPTVEAFAECDIGELEKMIYSTGFYRNKAKNIKAAAQMLMRDSDGKLPNTMEKLLLLPGVARKTANVILHTVFGKSVGITVDTHVIRLSGRLDLVSKRWVKSKNAVKIERELMKIISKREWGNFSHLLIHHGRKICVARKPKCDICPLNKICPAAFIF